MYKWFQIGQSIIYALATWGRIIVLHRIGLQKLISVGFLYLQGKEKNLKFNIRINRNSRREVFCKKGGIKNFAKFTGNTCGRVSFLIKALYQKKRLVQVFSCKFCEIFRNTFFNSTPPVAASNPEINILNTFKVNNKDRTTFVLILGIISKFYFWY